MSSYVSTKELKDVPAKTWLTEAQKKRLQRHQDVTGLGESALLRLAVLAFLDRIEQEGYTSLRMN